MKNLYRLRVKSDVEHDSLLRHPELCLTAGSQEMLKRVQHNTTNHPLPQSREREAEKLSSRFTLHPSLERKSAFTLAEVLITLGIIGVVAVMTMPPLIEKHQKQVTIARLKKIYSVLSQQILFANTQDIRANEYLSVGDKLSAGAAEDYFKIYWLNYFNGASILNGSPYGGYDACQLKYLNGDCYQANIYTKYDYGRVLFSTNDGYILYVNIMQWSLDSPDSLGDPLFSASQNVLIDINGLKGPNKLGRDVFRAVMNYNKNNVMPYDTEKSVDAVNRDCSKTGRGEACFAKIVKDGWKISDDYPW